MALFDKLFKRKDVKDSKASGIEHAVIVRFSYYKDDLDPLHALESRLKAVVKEAGVGEYDGHEIAVDMSDGVLYMYGPNAEALFKAVKPALEETDFARGAWATLRFGAAGSDAKKIEIQIEK